MLEAETGSLTTVKAQVVVGQIHDASDDITVFRLEGTNLYITDGDTTGGYLITSSYQLGTTFMVEFSVSGGVISYYYNDKSAISNRGLRFTGLHDML